MLSTATAIPPAVFNAAVEAGNKELADEKFKVATKAIDKAANKGVIKDNTASRKKSSLARTLNTL